MTMACAFSFIPSESALPEDLGDGAIYRDTTGALWVVYGGARFAIRDWQTFDALGLDPADIEPISLFALSQIGALPRPGTVLRELSSREVYVVGEDDVEALTVDNAPRGRRWIAVVPDQSLEVIRRLLACVF
jgi:hypothetical protein